MKKILFFILIIFVPYIIHSQSLVEIDSAFNKFLHMSSEVFEAGKNNDIQKQNCLSKEFNEFVAQHYLPLLPIIESEICQKNNFALLKHYLHFLDEYIYPTDEFNSVVLGELYIAQPDSVLNFLGHLKKKTDILEGLYYGFLSIYDPNEMNYNLLKQKIEIKLKEFRIKEPN